MVEAKRIVVGAAWASSADDGGLAIVGADAGVPAQTIGQIRR
jgi:hypothetical protein